MSKISVCIPCYEFGGLGAEVLGFNFQKLFTQTFKDFDVVISDNSQDCKIECLCESWRDRLEIHYFYNPKRGAATNSNNAIKMCKSAYIKFLCADDYLYDDNSLKTIYESFDEKTNWLFTGYMHTKDRMNYYRYHMPQIPPNVFTNFLGTPSAMAMRNPKYLPAVELFDENLNYCYDVLAYWQWIKILGKPKLISDITVANFIWPNSISSNTSEEMIGKENEYIIKKFGLS